MLIIAVAIAFSAAEPVAIAGGVSPGGKYEIALEADHDTPGFASYEFKGGKEQFPAFLVLERTSRAVLGRFPWPGAASETEAHLRVRSQIKWRPDGAAVAINTRDRFYAHSLVLVRDADSGRFGAALIPPYPELSGRQMPPAGKLRSRGRTIAIEWTPAGLLVLETWLWGDVDYPLSYRVSLQLVGRRLIVLKRQPVPEDTPSW